MKSFRTYQLAKELFHQAEALKIKGEMKDQLKRASLSMVLNLSEGSAKTGKERKRFFVTALGSLRESQAIFELLNNEEMSEKADKLGAYLYKLIQNPGPGSVVLFGLVVTKAHLQQLHRERKTHG